MNLFFSVFFFHLYSLFAAGEAKTITRQSTSKRKLTKSKGLKLKEFDAAMMMTKKTQSKSMARHLLDDTHNSNKSFQASILSKALALPYAYDDKSSKMSQPAFMQGRERDLLNDDYTYGGYGFDILDYSIKYTKCAQVETWNDEAAQENEFSGVTTLQNFIMFRLCPTETCSNNRQFGCSSNFGEYIVSFEDYLQSVIESAEERDKSYCELCETCFKEEDNGYGRKRRVQDEDEGEDQAEDQGNNAYDENNDDNELWFCDNFYSTCSNWEDDCVEIEYNRDYYDDQWEPPAEEINYGEFVDCTKVDIQSDDDYNNMELYIGPYCSSDGISINLDVFYDEFCSNYAGDVYSPSDLISNFDKEGLANYISTDCVSCNSADFQDEFDMEQYKDGGDNQNDQNYGDVKYEVLEMCEELFETAAKCHRSMNIDNESYMSDQQYNTETKVCNFIEEVVKGVYDENGTIKVGIATYAKEFVKSMHTEEVTDGQIIGLVFSLLACIFLGVYAAQLRNHLTGEMAIKKKYYYSGQLSPQRPSAAPLV